MRAKTCDPGNRAETNRESTADGKELFAGSRIVTTRSSKPDDQPEREPSNRPADNLSLPGTFQERPGRKNIVKTTRNHRAEIHAKFRRSPELPFAELPGRRTTKMESFGCSVCGDGGCGGQPGTCLAFCTMFKNRVFLVAVGLSIDFTVPSTVTGTMNLSDFFLRRVVSIR